MAETKYGKYFLGILEEKSDARYHIDDTVFKGSNFYGMAWIRSPHGPDFHDGPHIHKDAEVFFFLGVNPDDPSDLGGEMEMHMGPEMEKHIITKSCVLFIPPRFVHAPWRVTRVDRPFLMGRNVQGPEQTFRSLRNLLPKEEREKITPFLLFGNAGFEIHH